MYADISRVMIAGANTGGGKTTITCGLLAAMVARGMKTCAFKCGPDYIDPMFHSEVMGLPSRNLDLFLSEENIVRFLLGTHGAGADIAVVEGVMGYYDGLAGNTMEGSSYDIAMATQTPVVLVLDCGRISASVSAIARGFLTLRESGIQGILLNQVSREYYLELKEILEEEVHVPILGYLPFMEGSMLESRHLGLVTAQEVDDLHQRLARVAAQMEETVDLGRLIRIAESAPALTFEEPRMPRIDKAVTVAVAKDRAFNFYYQDNLELLEKMGAKIVFFSPISDACVPEEADGLLLGGGYPELYAKELSVNTAMLSSIQRRIGEGLPTVAECGGFMYLHGSLEGMDGETYIMAGVIDADCRKTDGLVRFGYLTLAAREDSMLMKKGDTIRGHEYHCWESTTSGESLTGTQPKRNASYACAVCTDSLYAGFPHLYFYSNIMAANRFLQACVRYSCEKSSEYGAKI